MKPVMQTAFGADGNCFQAAVASILEVELDTVPDFCRARNEDWMSDFRDWVRQFGFTAMMIDLTECPGWWAGEAMKTFQGCYCLLCGMSPRGLHHAVVGCGNTVVHDPHPSGDGIEGNHLDVIFLVPINPAQFWGKR